MRTTWGDIPVRDAHVHFFSHGFFAALALEAGEPSHTLGTALGWEMPDREPEALAARWITELDRHDVSSAALIASVHGDEASVAAAVARFPHRFHGYFMLNPAAPDAMQYARRALDHGLRGICLFPAMHRYSLHDERVEPVYDLAARRPGTLLFVHCGVLTVGARAKLGLPSPFDMRFSNPIDLHAVALRYPDVNFVVPHFGAGYFREVLMLCGMCPNVYLDTSSSNAWVRYLPEELDLARVLRRALQIAGPRRLLFGTDSSFFPRGWHRKIFDDQARLLTEMGLSSEDAGLIFGGNLARLMNL